MGATYGVWCTLCSSDLYFVSNHTCELCSTAMGNCTRCNSSNYCSECISSSYAFSISLSDCVLCSDMFPNCQECTATTCTVCQEGLHSLDGGLSCECVLGEYVDGVCS